MKQITEMLDRFFAGKAPLKKKWQVRNTKPCANSIAIYHYHHLILIYDLGEDRPVYQWWERQADKRGLDACLEYLKRRKTDV